ncbi:CLUMA_CG002476, isoform A [Clunio marinus]|uniref:CLUMA_CG002476, isoform A n=1 Tax=Clunio marinus TaxID=568069 RepID=A0A1J1HQC2_9DIPT|nr:CLUMA_CG002476, isoform A [Clunio marinus]
MKIVKFYISFILICYHYKNSAANILLQSSSNSSIPNFISWLINENNKREPQRNHNVVLIDLELTYKTEIFNNTLEEILRSNPDNAVMTSKRTKRIPPYRIHTASFIIIISDLDDSIKIAACIHNIFLFNKWQDSTKFIFVSTLQESVHRKIFFIAFDSIGVLNKILLRVNQGLLEVFSAKYFLRKIYSHGVKSQMNLDQLFPDQLKNLHGYTFQILHIQQYPRFMKVAYRDFRGIDVWMMQIITLKYNSRMNFPISIPWTGYKNISKFIIEMINIRTQKSLDLTLSTIVTLSDLSTKYINTYDENGYCALIPLPPRLTFLHFILTPYDTLSWMFMIGLVIICSILWKLSSRNNQRKDSAFYFFLIQVANFLGQSIPFRNSRRIQLLLLQLCIMMTFIMGNAYQSLIIPSMSRSREGLRIKTFDELIKSNISIAVTTGFYHILNQSNEFPTLIERSKVIPNHIKFTEFGQNRTALVMRCDLIESAFFHERHGQVTTNLYYILPDKIMKFYEKFLINSYSPFYEMLQMNYNKLFESGIKQKYENKFNINVKKIMEKREQNFIANENYLLRMQDIYGIFFILLFGYGVSFLTFIFELISRHKFEQIINKLIGSRN